MGLCKLPGGGQPVPNGQPAARQPLELPVVGREHREGGAFVQTIYMPRKGVYAIGVQDHGDVQICQQPADQHFCLGRPAQTGADEGRVAAPGPLQYFIIFLRQREGHALIAFDGYDGIDLPGNPQKHQTRSGADSGPGGQNRSPGVALGAGQNEDLSELPLVGGAGPPGQDVPSSVHHLCRLRLA